MIYMLHNKNSNPEVVYVTLDVTFILYADHTMNASTFTARIIASTLSDMHSAMTGAIAALKGPLHGGANEESMRMLEEVGEPARAAAYVKDRLARKQKIMGFGHAVYKTMDPRAAIFKEYSRMTGEAHGDTSWYENPKGKEGHWKRHIALDVTDNESPTFGDLTGDGKPEIICSSKGAYGYAVPDWNDPTKPWQWHNISPNNKYHKFTHGMGYGDVNGDGEIEFLRLFIDRIKIRINQQTLAFYRAQENCAGTVFSRPANLIKRVRHAQGGRHT